MIPPLLGKTGVRAESGRFLPFQSRTGKILRRRQLFSRFSGVPGKSSLPVTSKIVSFVCDCFGRGYRDPLAISIESAKLGN